MASCPKCGRAKVRRNKHGARICRTCGCLPSAKFMDRGGNPLANDHEKHWRAFEALKGIYDGVEDQAPQVATGD